MSAPGISDRSTRKVGEVGRRLSIRFARGALLLIVACSAPQLAYASPGCTALNGTDGPAFATTGSSFGTEFWAGDFITISMPVTGGVGSISLDDLTASINLIPQQNTVGSWTYTVPAYTTNLFAISGGGNAATERTWSCVGAPAPTPPPPGPSDATPENSIKLRSLQKSGTKTGAQIAGSAYAGIIGDAIARDTGHANGTLSPPQTGGVPSGASGLGMGKDPSTEAGSGRRSRITPWVNGRFSESGDDSAIDWQHTTIAAGASYAAAPGLIVGVFGGYETFDFDRNDIDAELDGNGRTAGATMAWLLAPKLRLDAAIAHTWLDYDAAAGTADADFDAGRWLFLTRLSGDHVAGRWTFTPSSEVFWLRETQDAYVDSLGTRQGKNSFTNGRANGGVQAAYAIPISAATTLSPFAGIYADYYFGMEDDGTTASEIGFGDGLAARATGGVTLSGVEGWSMTLGAEAGNLGGEGPEFWTGRLGGAVNF